MPAERMGVVSVCDPKAERFLYLDDLSKIAPDGAEFVVRSEGMGQVVIVGLQRDALASFARSTLRYLAQQEDRELDDEERALVGSPTAVELAHTEDESVLTIEQRARVEALWSARGVLGVDGLSARRAIQDLAEYVIDGLPYEMEAG